MYNERTNFSIRDIILQFLIIALFIFVLIWLFPMKSDLNKAIDSIEVKGNDNSVLYDRIFNENIISMKDSAKSYYTTPRLPKNIGDKVKMTLSTMLDKKIILPFVDKKGNSCDLDESYVEITKYDEEFILKVNLKCGNDENYLLVYMGCYDYCESAICEKEKSDIKNPVIYKSTTETKKTVNVVINKPVTPQKSYLYEYRRVTNGYYNETDWSEWSTTEVSASNTVSVRTRTETTNKLIGYNVKKVIDETKPIYGTKQIVIGYKDTTVCTKYEDSFTGKFTYGNWVDAGLETLYKEPISTDTVVYEYIRSGDETCYVNCGSTTYGIYRKYTRTKTAITEKVCTATGVQKEPIYTTIQIITGYEYKIISKEPVYQPVTVKYYSFKTRTYIAGTTDIKWSIQNDTTLLQAGYQYTGNTREK